MTHELEGLRERLELETVLAKAGEVGRLMLDIDWTATPLGPMRTWPPLLRSVVMTCVLSPFPMEVCLGPDLIYIYNDALRPLLGRKHPRGLGRPKRSVFPEVWDSIGPLHEDVLHHGRPTSRDGARFMLERSGYLEECYFTFSHSPIVDETGVIGVFTVIAETTRHLIDERRLRTLTAMAERSGPGRTVAQACAGAAEALAANPDDVPFALVYLVDDDGRRARLAARTGLDPRSPLAPQVVSLDSRRQRWPLRRALSERRPFAIELDAASMPDAGAWPHERAPSAALVVPLLEGTSGLARGVAVLAANPAREVDTAQERFLEQVGRQLAHVIDDARAHQTERARAELLADLNRAKTELLSNVSHELRTPLTLVAGPLRDYLSEPAADPAVQRDRVELALRSTRRLTRLVDRLLDFSRIEEGRIEAVYEPIELSRSTEELARAFQPAIEGAGLRLVVDCRPLGEPVYVDRELWEKALTNLISNAVKFTRVGQVKVTCRRVRRRAEVVVEDTGVGIDPRELPHVFERFHRVRSGWARTREGTGIGLSLVRETIELHGGTVSVRSREGVGTAFTIRLPLGAAHLPGGSVRAAAAAPREPPHVERSPAVTGPRGPTPGPGAARVVVVEDDPDMRQYVTELLRPHWQVEAFTDAAAALAAVRRQVPDLVLADVMLPTMDGFELLRRLRGSARTARVPVILLSARAGREATLEGLEAGADDYLLKPFSAHELVARVRTHLELTRGRESRARDTERRRVARELHDSVLQTLYGIALGSESIKTLVEQEPANVARVADYVVQLARSALREMRALILELRPEVLEQEGLVTAIQRLVAPMSSRHGLTVELDLGAEPQAPVHVKEALFRIAQEALQNVARHAGASRVRVGLGLEGGTLRLAVSDDGAGFDVRTQHVGHLGQRTMQERAELVGGVLEVTSAPGRGTRVLARVPVAPRPPGPG